MKTAALLEEVGYWETVASVIKPELMRQDFRQTVEQRWKGILERGKEDIDAKFSLFQPFLRAQLSSRLDTRRHHAESYL